MKRKILSVLIALTMVATLCFTMTACGDKESSGGDGDKTLTVWIHNDEDSWTKSYESIADNYMKENEGVKINFESFPYDEYETKIQTALMSDEGGADVYELWGGWGVDFAPSGALAQVPEDMEKEIRDEAYECTYGALENDGKLYGIPLEFNIECGGLVVNKNILNEAGVSVPKTWDELVDAAQKLTRTEGKEMTVKGFDFVNWDGVMYLFTSMILSQGGQYLNDDGTFNFTSKEAKTAFKELADLVQVKKVTNMAGLDDGSDIEGYQELYAGQAAMVPRGPWVIAEGINDFELEYGKDFSYEKMPFYSDKKAFAAETGWSMGVSSSISEEQQELAFDFLNYFFSDDVIMSHNLACGQIPAKKKVAQSEDYVKQFPYAKPLVGILDGAQFIGFFNTDVFKENVNDVFSAYISGKYSSVDAALKKLEKKCNKMTEKK